VRRVEASIGEEVVDVASRGEEPDGEKHGQPRRSDGVMEARPYHAHHPTLRLIA
jgi:hypothetical protein